MTKYFRFWPLLAGMALAGLWVQHNAALRNEGALREQIAGLNARNAKLEDEAGRIDTVYHTDTITLRKVRYATDTLLQRDTVIHTDTVRAILTAEREACNAVVLTCEQKQANLRARLAISDSLLTAEKHTHPSWFSRALGKAAWAAAGYVAGSVTHK